MADRRGALVPLLILAWLFLQPEPQRSPAELQALPSIDDVIAREELSLSRLQNSTWNPQFGDGSHVLNVTGLEAERGYAWYAVPKIKARAREQLQYALGDWGTRALEEETEMSSRETPLYGNVTGFTHGKWKRSKLQQDVALPKLNLTQYAPLTPFGKPGPARNFDRNITGDAGDVSIWISEKEILGTSLSDGSNITAEMTAEVKLTDPNGDGSWELKVRGLYFKDIGQAILTTTSDKFAGIFTLPHLALSLRTFESSRKALNETISRSIQRQIDGYTNSRNPWTSRNEGGQETPFQTPDCELIVYLQQMAPVTDRKTSSSWMSFLERELRFPTGAFVPNAPDIRLSMLAFSPDCGYVLESQGPPDDFAQDGNHISGPKEEVQYLHSRHHLIIYAFSLATQLFLLMRQMLEANTPSTRSRISFYTIAMLALGDGFITMAFLTLSLFISGVWLNLVATGFLAFISVSFFGMRFLLDLWQVQAPERERIARAEVEEDRRRDAIFNAALQRIRAERLAATPRATASSNNQDTEVPQPDAASDTPNITGSLPLPVTAPRPPLVDTGATPVFMPSDQAGLEPITPFETTTEITDAQVAARMPTFSSLYIRFYLLLLFTLFLSLNAGTSWPSIARRIYFAFLGMIYMSFWIPQITRNVKRNCRHALNWEFVLGQSLLRLTPFAYFYGYKHNVLFTDTDYYSLALLAIWVWLQVLVLASQEIVGPRWFLLRKDWAPLAYDYHPILREDEEGATMPIGFSQAAAAAASTPSSPTDERIPLTRRNSLAAKEASKEKGKRIFDCAICMQDLEVPVVEAGAAKDASLGGGILARRMYMVTPCRHIFHTACLEGWMKYRLQCPICREGLPPT
ncbi:unnamed protein product [Zymoseptoria tritici ST99CH_3D7]|uniref:DSC E3 ubiquitin ligase complex subunit A n=1 Tax=Zymoseptoria tritici (strain ST99CH_3D7) TaxID=1276538 RepID=A0A1X7RIU0_ZYMT9|nr:unnamed protein product [Zymoseptoria tritici ST99CH_3D7]